MRGGRLAGVGVDQTKPSPSRAGRQTGSEEAEPLIGGEVNTLDPGAAQWARSFRLRVFLHSLGEEDVEHRADAGARDHWRALSVPCGIVR